MNKLVKGFGFGVLGLLLVGCAQKPSITDAAQLTNGGNGEIEASEATGSYDPWEGFNRPVYTFNRSLDKAIYRPVARGYRDYIPSPIRTGITNFTVFVDLPVSIISNILQWDLKRAAIDTGRLGINATLGIFGLIDTASYMGLERRDEDFDQAFGVWGIPDGPYIMVPFIGPYTAREVVGDILKIPFTLDAILGFKTIERFAIYAFSGLDSRVRYLDVEPLLEASPDEYVFLREVYLQNQRNKVTNGELELVPPEDDVPEEFFDEIDE